MVSTYRSSRSGCSRGIPAASCSLMSEADQSCTAMFTYTGQATAHAAQPLSSAELAAVKRFPHDLAQAYDLTDPLAGLQDAPPTGVGHIDRHAAARPAARTRRASTSFSG